MLHAALLATFDRWQIPPAKFRRLRSAVTMFCEIMPDALSVLIELVAFWQSANRLVLLCGSHV